MASLLYGLAGKLLRELCSPVLQDVGKSWGFGTKDEFEKLKSTLSAIEAVLLDAEEKQRTNRQVQDWLMKIKLVFYDVEDLLMEVTTQALQRQVMTKNKMAKEVHIFFSSSNQVKYRLKIGRKVKLIRERMDAIASDCTKFNLSELQEEMGDTSNTREESHSFVPLDQVIGRDEDKKYITKLLLESDVVDNVSVISVVGVGGLGKTTLAQSVYSSKLVRGNFEVMMWVCVSNVFTVKVICEKIIESTTKTKYERHQMDEVRDKLKELVDGRKYLLVLDDMWNENPVEWMKLEELLIGGSKGSKILITARAELVARAANSFAVHFLKGLSHKESRALFKQVAFRRRAEPLSSAIEEIVKEVVETSSGVPLAIKAMGSMLGLKEKEIEWLDFKKNDLRLITQDSEGKVVPILKMSYNYLSGPLKRCFAYCAVFPKDYQIDKDTLIKMWMAHGLLQLDGTTRSLEDVGKKYFMDLLDRSFIETQGRYEVSSNGCYKMHDLIHDLAQSIGWGEYCKIGSCVNNIGITTRHAWGPLHKWTNLLPAKKLRTLVVRDSFDMQGHTVKEIMSVFKKMRVLDLTRLYMRRVPQCVGGLTHLNYLDLSYNFFNSLPESICSLYNLQTLILVWCANLKELPLGTRNLMSLRHLNIDGCRLLSHMPQGLGELTCLQSLGDFVVGPEGMKCGGLGDLGSLVNLTGELRIRNLRDSKNLRCTRDYPLTQLKSVHHLELKWVVGEDEDANLSMLESLRPHSNLEKLIVENFGGKNIPRWMDKVNIGISLPHVVSIQLYSCKNLRHLPPFGLLPSLEELHLWGLGCIRYIYEEWNINGDSASTSCGGSCTPEAPTQLFPALKVLRVGDMPKLTRLVGPTASSCRLKNHQHFPVLEKLQISSCSLFVADGSDELDGKRYLSLREVRFADIERLPTWLQFLPRLHTLQLHSCNKIMTLPRWMGNLTSVREIKLEYCESLASLPNCLRRLTSLQRLEVEHCPKLFSRCNKETGEDWHKIAHIPNILLKK